MNKVSFRSRLRHYSLQGWLRYLRLKLLGKELVVEGHCVLCGRCCRRISLEAGGQWLRNRKKFEQMLNEYPEHERFRIIGRDQQGFLLFSCDWFDEQTGVCSDHANRLDLCRSYPDPELYFTGGELNKECGYRFSEIVPFKRFLDKEIALKDDMEKDANSHR